MKMTDVQHRLLANAWAQVVLAKQAAATAESHLNDLILGVAGSPARLEKTPEGKLTLILLDDDAE